MVSAEIEELCKEVSFEKGTGNYAGWDEDAINYTLRKYQAQHATKKGNQEFNAIIRLSLIFAQGTHCSRRSHYLLEGWQPSEPNAVNGEHIDPTLPSQITWKTVGLWKIESRLEPLLPAAMLL
eukprot:13928832-Heterocapsa_arctica.AAC.1